MKKKKVKVLIFGMTSIVGGIETFLINVYEKINLDNIQMDFIVPGKLEGDYRKRIEKRNSRIYEIDKIKSNPLKSFKEIRDICKKNQYDIIHVNLCNAFYFIYILPAILWNKNKPKIITHSHNNSDNNKLIHYIMKPILMYYTDYFYSCSLDAAKWMFFKKVIKENNIVIINNAIDVKKYKFDNEIRIKYRKALGVEDNFVIGHVGRFEEQKNHEFLIDIFNKYKKVNSNSKLILVGDGSLKEKMIKKVKKLNLEEDVLFLGVRNDVNNLMQAFDMFILPSKFEGFGIVGLEAQASGLYALVSQSVALELAVTPNIKFMDVNEKKEKWISEIERIRKIKIDRKIEYKEIEKSEYSLDKLVGNLEKKYLIYGEKDERKK